MGQVINPVSPETTAPAEVTRGEQEVVREQVSVAEMIEAGSGAAQREVDVPTKIQNQNVNPASAGGARTLPSSGPTRVVDGPRASAVLQLAADNLVFLQHALNEPYLLATLMEGYNRVPSKGTSAGTATAAFDDTVDIEAIKDVAGVPVRTVERIAIDLLDLYPDAGQIAHRMLEATCAALDEARKDDIEPREKMALKRRLCNLEGVLHVTLVRVHFLEKELREVKASMKRADEDEWAVPIADRDQDEVIESV